TRRTARRTRVIGNTDEHANDRRCKTRRKGHTHAVNGPCSRAGSSDRVRKRRAAARSTGGNLSPARSDPCLRRSRGVAMSRELVWVCDVCGHREPVIEPSEEPEDRYYPGDAEVCLHGYSGI